MMKLISMGVAVLSLCSVANAQEKGDVEAGKALAEKHCTACHNIAPGGAFKLYPPSFAAIAVYMDPDIIRMRIMYPSEHTQMPQFYQFMTAAAREDLTAYIVSLEKK